MKRFFFSLISFLVLCVSCTDNDDTGDLYGQWKITSISENGSVILQPSNLYLSFQGDVVFIRVSDHVNNIYQSVPGVFHEQADSLMLSFYVDNETSRNIILQQFLMDDNPTDLRFALQKKSPAIIITRGVRQWQMIEY